MRDTFNHRWGNKCGLNVEDVPALAEHITGLDLNHGFPEDDPNNPQWASHLLICAIDNCCDVPTEEALSCAIGTVEMLLDCWDFETGLPSWKEEHFSHCGI